MSTTAQPYSSLILWTGTTRRWRKKTGAGDGRGGHEDGKEGRRRRRSKNENTPSSTLTIWNRCLHNNTIHNRYAHSHCHLNLSLHWEVPGDGNTEGRAEGEEISTKATSCSQHHQSQNGCRPYQRHCLKKNRLICSSILVRPHESLRAVQLFILTERLWFHHSLQATKMEFARFNSQRSLRVSLTWGKWFSNH